MGAGGPQMEFATKLQLVVEEKGGILLSEYVNGWTNVKIVCENGHKWEAKPGQVLDGSRTCPYCIGGWIWLKNDEVRKARKSWDALNEEIRASIEAKGGILLSEYVNSHTKVKIDCGRGHTFSAMPCAVKGGKWCPGCRHNRHNSEWTALKLKEFQELIKERGGTIPISTEWINSSTKITITCAEWHKWEVRPASVKNGTWCPHCARKAPGTIEGCQRVAAERGGWCKSTDYVNCRTKMLWRCAEGHEWEATYHSIKNSGSWCPICRNKSENAVRTMLKYALELDFPSHSPKALERLGIELRNAAGNQMTLDGFCLDIVCAFEFHGYQHTDPTARFHTRRGPGSFLRRQKDDEMKREQCERLGIVLFEVYEEQHGVWPHLNRLYSGLLDVLEENGVEVTGKPNLSDSAWMQLIASDREQTTLAGYFPDGSDPHVSIATRLF